MGKNKTLLCTRIHCEFVRRLDRNTAAKISQDIIIIFAAVAVRGTAFI